MTAIPIHLAPLRAKERYREVLSSALLSDLLTERETADYPLPIPETWVVGRFNISRQWRALNINEVVGAIHKAGEARYVGEATGDSEQYGALQLTSYDIGIITKAPHSFEPVEVNGRLLTDDEWMEYRAELYRGVIIDTVTRWIPNPDAIHEVAIESSDADLFELPNDMGRFAHATVTFETKQDVLIRTWI